MVDVVSLALEAVRAVSSEERCREAVRRIVRAAEPPERWLVAGAGKACVAMARGALGALREAGAVVSRGLLVTKNEAMLDDPLVEVRRAGHPLPDARSEVAGLALLELLSRATVADRVLFCLSGGASALIAAPAGELGLVDVAAATGALLAAGVPIGRVNAVRQLLSRTAGGSLARASAAPVDVVVVSDVLGDDPSVIGSGPFSPPRAGYCEALAIAGSLGAASAAVIAFLRRGVRGELSPPARPRARGSRHPPSPAVYRRDSRR